MASHLGKQKKQIQRKKIMAFTASFPKIVKYQIHQALHISLCAPHFNGFGEEHAIGKADDENTTRFQNPKSFPQDVHWSLHVLNRNSHKNLGRVLCTKTACLGCEVSELCPTSHVPKDHEISRCFLEHMT